MRTTYQRILAMFIIVAMLAPGLAAQQEIVSAIKNDLVARQVNLTGPCGAFEITKRVAWALRAQGVGLLDKPGGNNCQGYSVDYLVFPDGSGRDILGDGGGENIPQWGGEPSEAPGTFTGRWRAPFDPGDAALPPGPAPVPQPPAPSPIVPALTLLQQTLNEFRQESHEETIKAEEERRAQRQFRSDVGVEWGKITKWIAVIGGSVLAGGGISKLLGGSDPAK